MRSNLFDATVDDVQIVARDDRERYLRLLHQEEREFVGRSSALVLAAALKLCEQVKNKTILIVFYDPYDAYL